MNNEIENKKYIIEQAIQLNMDMRSAMVLAECSEEEEELLQNDELFMRKLKVTKVIREKELLEQFDRYIESCAERGNLRPIQWRLSKLNPRWGNTTVTVTKPQKESEESNDEEEQEEERIANEINYILESKI